MAADAVADLWIILDDFAEIATPAYTTCMESLANPSDVVGLDTSTASEYQSFPAHTSGLVCGMEAKSAPIFNDFIDPTLEPVSIQC